MLRKHYCVPSFGVLLGLLLIPSLAVAGCGVGQTSTNEVFRIQRIVDHGASMARLEKQLRHVPIAAGADIAVGVTDSALAGVPLTGGSPWIFTHPIDSQPTIAGSVVVGSGAGDLFCLQASTGKLLWVRKTGGLAIRGAGDDGHTTVVTLASTLEKRRSLLAIRRDGTVLRQLETPKDLGQPAIVGNLVFVPWEHQYITALDLVFGHEVARLTLPQQSSYAIALNHTFYFGEVGLVRFDEHIADAGMDKAQVALLPNQNIVGASTWFLPASEEHPVHADTKEKIRVYARPAPRGKPMGVEGHRYYTTYFRIVFGLRTPDANLDWVHSHPSDILAGTAYQGGLALCDVEGRITFLEANSGMLSSQLQLPIKPTACVMQSDALARAPSGMPFAPFIQQVSDAISMDDADLIPAQRYLVHVLSEQSDSEVTKMLIEKAGDPHTPKPLLGLIRDALAARRNGINHMLSALSAPYESWHDPTQPPVGPLADALKAMGEKRAAPLLSQWINNPKLPSNDTKRAAAAMLVLAGESELTELESFFSLYRCTADNPDRIEAVVLVAEAIQKIGGAKGKELVAQAARDPLTKLALQQKLTGLTNGSMTPPDPFFIDDDTAHAKHLCSELMTMRASSRTLRSCSTQAMTFSKILRSSSKPMRLFSTKQRFFLRRTRSSSRMQRMTLMVAGSTPYGLGVVFDKGINDFDSKSFIDSVKRLPLKLCELAYPPHRALPVRADAAH